jgi:hypothetical protein
MKRYFFHVAGPRGMYMDDNGRHFSDLKGANAYAARVGVAQITYHLNRAMDNELTPEQARSQHTPGLLRGLAPCDVGAELRLP